MSESDWYAQGVMLGTMTTIKDWNETMNAATNDPGTVQIHIQRTLDKQNKAVEINRKENCKPCGYKAELHYCPNETKVIAEYKAAAERIKNEQEFYAAEMAERIAQIWVG